MTDNPFDPSYVEPRQDDIFEAFDREAIPASAPTPKAVTIGEIIRLPSAEYHADPAPEPSLSATLAKLLISRSPRHAWMASPRLNVPPASTLCRWLARETALRACPLRDTMNFIARYPDPGDAQLFIDGIGDRFREQMASREAQLLARRLDVERQREQRRREHLAREWAPRVRDHGPLAGLDKDTVQALRGY